MARERVRRIILHSSTKCTCFSFELKDVTIGINFHWERKEVQKFKGELKIIIEGEQLTAINVISIEEYLTSVISSEMSATASLELLKAHAVISRSWLLEKNKELRMKNEEFKRTLQKDSAANSSFFIPNSSFIKWYDHEAHRNFDVCADDHCQRYQGITRASTPQAIEAVSATRGEVLMYKGAICDARFSKCCGGAFEEFQNCWENIKHPYLIRQRDSKTEKQLPDLTIEAEADKWIRTSPVAFCNTQDKKISKPSTKQLRSGNSRLLSLESQLFAAGAFRTDSSTFRD